MRPIKLNTAVASIMLLFCVGITQAQAQESTISMEMAVKMATENYPTLKAANLSIDKEKALKASAWDFGTTNIYTSGEELGNNNNDATYTTIGIGQSGIDVFGIAPKNKLAKTQIKLAEANVALTILEVKQQVQKAWIKAFTAKQMYLSFSEIDEVFSDLNKAIDLRYETEAISKLEYNATANQGRLITLKKGEAFANYQMAIQVLNQWLMSDDVFDVETVALDDFDTVLVTSETTLKNHPLYAYWQTQLDIANAEEKVANSKFLPTLSAEYGFQKIGSQSGFNSYQVGIQIPLIFNKTRGEVKALKLNTDIIEQETIANKIQLESRFGTMTTQYKQLQKSWNYYKSEALPLAIEQRNGVSLSYKEGAIGYIAFIQNMKDAVQLEINTWNVLQEFLVSKIQLEYLLNQSNNDEI